MKLRVSRRAGSQISRHGGYVASRNPAAAARVIAAIYEAFDLLTEFPDIGYPLPKGSAREWVPHGLPYVIVYRADHEAQVLSVLAVYHAAQNRPGR
jgi:plasmid stabilization system protein ParE